MQLRGEERETIIRYDETGGPATVYTCNGVLGKKLRQLAEKFPADARLWREEQHGGVAYQIPKEWVTVRAPRVLTEEQREETEFARLLEPLGSGTANGGRSVLGKGVVG